MKNINAIRWQLYRALKWLAMAICPPTERAVIEILEERQAQELELSIGAMREK